MRFLTLMLLLFCLSTQAVAQKTGVSVTSTRLVAWTLPLNGKSAQMVLINWKNTSKKPVYVVHADIVALDAQGKELDSGAKDYTIFASSSKPIKPGQTYQEPKGEGFVLMSSLYGKAKKVKIRITRVQYEKPNW